MFIGPVTESANTGHKALSGKYLCQRQRSDKWANFVTTSTKKPTTVDRAKQYDS